MKLLIYIGQVIVLSGLLYGYYHLFLRNGSFNRFNRFCLLMVCVLSVLIPCISIPLTWPASGSESQGMVRLLETVYVDPSEQQPTGVPSISLPEQSTVSWSMILTVVYVSVALLFLGRLLIGLNKLRKTALFYHYKQVGNVKVFLTKEAGTPFSFFNIVFWDDEVDLQSEKGKQIFHHEMIHVQQKHSYDVILTELLTIIYWVNPFFHLIKKELRVIHEFLADEPAALDNSSGDYAELLLMRSLRTKQSLVNPFFHNQIKRRIAMITKTSITRSRYARQFMILPLAAVLFGMVAFRLKPVRVNSPGKKELTVVVDAGHGGFDPGAKSPDHRFEEATMTLEFATLMQSLAPEYGIKVILTRENEEAIGKTKQEDLMNRLRISKEAKPDMFFSFHVNSTGKADAYQANRSGFDIFIAGKREDMGGKVIASALLEKLSSVYKAEKVVKQRNDAGVYVLDQNNVPSVMLQCGYINNQKDLEFFNNKENREKVVRIVLAVLLDSAAT
ncbi:M56/M15 family metallopeptidase [Terrimonas sp. NA20]|uniref:N-acetylmuramoyl-L-alanine amidase n=1 Tax=Terrimonas ginsenosidimutans TaxID=2908004 RepID=A0ABS9KU41_9BACT|nr:M56/M15 family metallopeptidase [Terrimonas ginsenosidimutans]MCG2615845.1 M56/M15 family metallopeptidase [Terrimonas ginsenosidimutans]